MLTSGRGELGFVVDQALHQARIAGGQDLDRQQPGIDAAANRDRGDGHAARHLDDRQQGVQPVHRRHGHIEDDGVGLQLCRQSDRPFTVAGLADHLEATVGLQVVANEIADLGVVVDHQHSPSRREHHARDCPALGPRSAMACSGGFL